MGAELKSRLVFRLKQSGAYDVKIADPQAGFEHALPGRHPLDLWPECRSLVVFAVAMSPDANNTYAGTRAPWSGSRNLGPVPGNIESETFAFDRLSRLISSSVTLKGATVLMNSGYSIKFPDPLAIPVKLCAYESGLGIYGRSGLILHPELGSRLNIGVIFTNAVLPADSRCKGFNPCKTCDRCVKCCPASAFEANEEYPASFSQTKCIDKRRELAAAGVYCHECYKICPSGGFSDADLLRVRTAVTL